MRETAGREKRGERKLADLRRKAEKGDADAHPKTWCAREDLNLPSFRNQIRVIAASMAVSQACIDLAGSPEIKSRALDDPDLSVLWSDIAEI